MLDKIEYSLFDTFDVPDLTKHFRSKGIEYTQGNRQPRGRAIVVLSGREGIEVQIFRSKFPDQKDDPRPYWDETLCSFRKIITRPAAYFSLQLYEWDMDFIFGPFNPLLRSKIVAADFAVDYTVITSNADSELVQ